MTLATLCRLRWRSMPCHGHASQSGGSLCALQRLAVVTSASSSGSDKNGRYYIAVEPWPAAMALLSTGEGACRQDAGQRAMERMQM